jgi:hypothetical protein
LSSGVKLTVVLTAGDMLMQEIDKFYKRENAVTQSQSGFFIPCKPRDTVEEEDQIYSLSNSKRFP